MGYVFALLSVFSFGLSNCLWVKPLAYWSVWQVMAWLSFMSTLLFTLLLLVSLYGNVITIPYGVTYKSIGLYTYATTALFCAYSYFGLVFYNLALKQKIEVSITVPVTCSSAFWGLCTAYIAYNDVIDKSKFSILLLFMLGVFLIDKQNTAKQLKLSRGIAYALVAAFIWGTSFALFPIFIKDTGVGLFSLILESTVCVCSISIVFITKGHRQLVNPSAKQLVSIVPIAVCGFLGVLFFNIATQYIAMSSLILLDLLTPIVSVVISGLLLHEKLTIKQYTAITIILIAVLLIKL